MKKDKKQEKKEGNKDDKKDDKKDGDDKKVSLKGVPEDPKAKKAK